MICLEFHGPSTPAHQGLCGFDKGRSLVVKLNVKSLATPCVAKLTDFYLKIFFDLVSSHMDSSNF